MKIKNFFPALLVCVVLFSLNPSQANDLSEIKIREMILNKEFVIFSTHQWKIASGDEVNGFKINDRYIPKNIKYNGKIGQVISVQKYSETINENKNKIDLFGQPIEKEDLFTKNPRIQVIVKIEDEGILIGASGYFDEILGKAMQTELHIKSIKSEIDDYLKYLIGKTIYKELKGKLYKPEIGLEDFLDIRNRDKLLDYNNTFGLTPLKVIDAKHLEKENIALLKVELQNGDYRMIFGEFTFDRFDKLKSHEKLNRLDIPAIEKIPSKLTKKEVDAIRSGSIFRGMSKNALHWSFGFPISTNDWGKSGKQLIYKDDYYNIYIYLKNDAVYDWQTIKK